MKNDWAFRMSGLLNYDLKTWVFQGPKLQLNTSEQTMFSLFLLSSIWRSGLIYLQMSSKGTRELESSVGWTDSLDAWDSGSLPDPRNPATGALSTAGCGSQSKQTRGKHTPFLQTDSAFKGQDMDPRKTFWIKIIKIDNRFLHHTFPISAVFTKFPH